jgi:uncharacterized protein
MYKRQIEQIIRDGLRRQAAVAIVGPRQVGKTTLALEIANEQSVLYLDLENRADRDKLADPELFLRAFEDNLVILDEIHRVPEIFSELRGIIDQGRRNGKGLGRFLILGSAALDLLRQSSETLAGRIEYVELGPLNCLEIQTEAENKDTLIQKLWVRGGFPQSYLASSDKDSMFFRLNFIRTYLERDVPQFGPRIPSQTLERLWTMLAHNQGGQLNASKLAASLMISTPTVSAYIDLLVDLLLVRRLCAYHTNSAKRIIKAPKIYVRDSGLTHALLGLEDFNGISGHPVAGDSWEGFVIENLIQAAPARTLTSYYRASGGAEIDLILEIPGRLAPWAIEIKRGHNAKPEKGFYSACKDIDPERAFVVHSGNLRYPLNDIAEAIGLSDMCGVLSSLSSSADHPAKR